MEATEQNTKTVDRKMSSLSIKLLVPLTTILAVSLLGLSLVIIKSQNDSLNNMGRQINILLSDSNKAIGNDLENMNTDVSQKLINMSLTAADQLSQSTNESLDGEKKKIESGWIDFLEKNAKSMATLLAKVAPSAILNNDYTSLISYIKSANSSENIVYAIYLRPNNKPYVRYLDKKKEKIKEYLRTGKGKKKYEKVINASQNDASVLIVKKKVELEGKELGSLLLCMSKAQAEQKIMEMSTRFNFLISGNSTKIQLILKNETEKLKNNMSTKIVGVLKKNETAVKKTGDRILQFSDQVNDQTKSKIWIFGTICCSLILISSWLLFRYFLFNPLKQITSGLKSISTGDADLTQRLEIKTRDELGELAMWFNAFIKRLNNIIVDIGANAETVTAASGELLSVSEQMSDGADELSGKANTVAVASEEMSSNMNSVAAASEQASTNIGMVTDSASQMQSTLGEVATNCEKASTISRSATDQVDKASERVKRLGKSAQAISKVTEVITDIAEQTNLLALNATIEAARAGEAGNGFAVVAGEIKSLAGQTAQATKDIKEKVAGIQSSTDDTVMDVTKISEVIADVNEIVTNIAAAVEEQSTIATEVAQNIEQAFTGIGEVNENVAQSSQVSSEITKDISGVNMVAEDMSKRSTQMNQSAMDLSNLSSKLRDMISVFNVSVENAQYDNTSDISKNDIPDLMS